MSVYLHQEGLASSLILLEQPMKGRIKLIILETTQIKKKEKKKRNKYKNKLYLVVSKLLPCDLSSQAVNKYSRFSHYIARFKNAQRFSTLE